MAYIQGAKASGAIRRAATWGTAAAVGAGGRLRGEFTPSFNSEVLRARTIGSGRIFATDATQGNYVPTLNFKGDMGYRMNHDVILALFMGTVVGAGVEQTGGQLDYLHTISLSTTANNSGYQTIVYEDSSTTVMEMPTAACTKVSISTPSVPGYLEFSADFVGDLWKLSSPTNNNAAVVAATFTEGDPEQTTCDFTDTFWIDTASTGALASADQVNITSWALELNRPQECIPEIKFAAGNSAPVPSGEITGTVTVGLKALDDHTWYTVWSAETSKKMKFSVEGNQIGSGVNKRFTSWTPKMKLIQEVGTALTDPGRNPVTLTFELFDGVSAPTGFSYAAPYFEFVNGLSTSLVA